MNVAIPPTTEVVGFLAPRLRENMKVKHYKEWEKKYGGTNVYDKDWFGRDAK